MKYILEKKDIEEIIDFKLEMFLKDIRKDIAILLNWKINIDNTLTHLSNQIDKLKEMMV